MLICEAFACLAVLVMQLLQKCDRPTVQLLHKMPDGSSHFDWMIAQDGTDDKRELTTYRLESRLDRVQNGQSILVERIADHRWAYLEYEGPISGNRGVVSCVAKGVVTSQKRDESIWRLEICWEIDSKSVMHQKLQIREIHTSKGGLAMEALCQALEMINK